jgi:hypothetical protein
MSLVVSGAPSGAAAFRGGVAAAVDDPTRAALRDAEGVRLAFVVRPRQFVDLDTLAEAALAGLRDAGAYDRGFPGLDAVLAEKAAEGSPGLVVAPAAVAALCAVPPPGPAPLDVVGALPGPRAPGKAAWRDAIAAAWAPRQVLDAAAVWADVALAVGGSLLGPLEPVLDALEPVLGRDPRGRAWQAFFPNDDRILWLRVHRAPRGDPPVRLRLGPIRA